jgi:multiple sugar transport system permease protein
MWFFIVVGLFIMVIPGVWMVLASFKTRAEIMEVPMRLLPNEFMLKNYTDAIKYTFFPRTLLNSLIVTIAVTLANIFTCTWGGYTFSKLRWPGRDTVFLILLATMMIPGFLTVIPRYILVAKLGMLNSYAGMIVPFLTGAFGIFLTKQYMMSVPDELMDAARVDGCNPFDIYWRIVLPMCTPIMSVLAIFVFNWIWDDLLWGTMVLTSPVSWTIPVALANLQAQGQNFYELQMAGATLAVIPVLIVFIVFQKNIVQGVALSGIKG